MTNDDVYTLKAAELSFSCDVRGQQAAFDFPPYSSSDRGRFWSAAIATPTQRDIGIHSEHQTGTVVESEAGIQIHYDALVDEEGTSYKCNINVEIATDGTEISFRSSGHMGEDLRIQEFAIPTIEISPTRPVINETLYRAEGLGRAIPNPRQALARAHTEYMVDDGIGTWELAAYPGELSMPWHGLASDEKFLYMGRHSSTFTSTLAASGIPARGGNDELWLSMISPCGTEEFDTGNTVVANFAGSWREGADYYRSWADSWYTGPHPDTEPLNGWQRIIMRHQYGKVYFKYSDLVSVYEESKRHGLNGILLFGWWQGGFDKGYPVYEADPELGGEDELRKAIAEINRRGGFISLYANGNLIDRTSQYFREHAQEVSKKDYRGLDHVVGYDFASDARTSRHFSANSFVIACHGAETWRQEMLKVARIQAGYGARSVFFDQTGYHMAAWPCFDVSHDHGSNAGAEPRSRINTLKAIRKASNNATLGSEGMADCMIPHLNFHHGWGFAFKNETEAFPALFRHVFPEPVVSNRLIHDENHNWQDQLNYAFAYNLAFDISIHRGRATISQYPNYAKHLTKLSGIRASNQEFFSRGNFQLIKKGPLTHVTLTVENEVLHIFWNSTSQTISEGTAGPVCAHDILVTIERKTSDEN